MIEAKNLTMCYGPMRAIDDVSFKIGERQIVGFLGPNGAGKTTLMRVLTTFLYPTRGTALIAGFDVTERPLEVRRAIGYLPETPPLYTDMRVDEYVDFTARARGLRGALLRQRKEWVVDACEIAPVWKHEVNELSLGFRQRVGLAQALVHDPRVVILDEPTTGLDPLQIVGVRGLIKKLAQTKTILFSTHILQEAAAISDRLFIMNGGRLAAQGSVAELQGREPSLEAAFLNIFQPEADPSRAGRRSG